jgi:hypothetical protein
MQVFKRFYDLHFTLSYSLHYLRNVKFYIKQAKRIQRFKLYGDCGRQGL